MTPPLQSLRYQRTILATDGGGSADLGQKRHRILRELQRELERHTAVQRVAGNPDGEYRELRVLFDPAAFNADADEAVLRVTWWPAPDEPEYAFHYSDDTGFDCGWHREPNPHIDGKLHYQERTSPDEPYESVSFPADAPPRILWTVLDRLTERLR